MSQRLLLASVSTFVSSSRPGVSVLLCTVLCLLSCVLHTVVPAFRDGATRYLQTAFLLCLTVVSLSSAPLAQALESATVSLALPSDTAAQWLFVTFWYFVPCIAVLVALGVPVLLKRLSVGSEPVLHD
jgi:hypothetical protein